MNHGISGFFSERRRFERRLSIFTAGVALALLTAQLLVLFPPLRRTVAHTLRDDLSRWGFEGPDQMVRRIILTANGPGGTVRQPAVTYVPRAALRGGSTPRKAHAAQPVPDPRRRGVGPGDSPQDLLTLARSMYHEAPVVQSEDLVIERLVKPDYPEDARDHNIEGRVALVALVDTTGSVQRVDLMSSNGERLLEAAAADAVRQCRFRPYRKNGHVTEVYAVFRFAFTLY